MGDVGGPRGPRRSGAGRSAAGGGKGGTGRSGRPGSPRGTGPRRDDRSGAGRKQSQPGKPAGNRTGGKPRRDSDRAGAKPRRAQERRSQETRTAEQARYDGPPLDESITGRELDRSVRQQLRGLPEKLAIRVARHLVAAGQLIDDDPETAHQHALAARARAARIAVVREACGEAAYAAEEYGEALAELRAAKRMNGSNDYLPLMADCERALGRPEKALALARSPAVSDLPADLRAEMTIVEAGARRDRGELDAALRTLEGAPLHSRSRAEWVVRLRYAYADTLLASGRRDDALVWFHRTVGTDSESVTDAAQRVAELEGADVADASGEDPAGPAAG